MYSSQTGNHLQDDLFSNLRIAQGARYATCLQGFQSTMCPAIAMSLLKLLPSGKHAKNYGKLRLVVDLPVRNGGFP